MKKFTITVISLFMVLLISLSAVGEAMGTSSKYASNQDYIQSENLALRDKSNKMTDGKDSSVYRFKTRNGGESIIDLGESCDFNSVILKEKGLNVQKFSISVSDDNENFTQIYANDKIEFNRLCTFDTVKARYVKLPVEKSDNLPKIREIVLMGGAYGTGNFTPSAEFNIFADPEAARVVFTSGVPLVMMGLDLTNQTVCTPDVIARMERAGGPAGELFSDIMNFTLKTQFENYGLAGGPVHDATCIGYLINPDGIKTQEMYVEVDVNSGPCYGRTVCDELGVLGKPANTKIGITIDTDWFWGLVEECVRGYIKTH